MTAIVLYSAMFQTHAPEDHEEGKGPVRWVNPDDLTPQQSLDLVRDIEAGEVAEVRFRSEAFGDVPNLNGTRLEPGRLPDLLASVKREPLVTDHSLSVKSIAGHVFGGEVVERDGHQRLMLDRAITEPAEMIAFARKQRRFTSIAIDAESWSCSDCEEPTRFGFFGPMSDCKCESSEIFGRGDVQFIHDSFVSIPAYSDAVVGRFKDSNETGVAFFGALPVNPHPHKSEDTMSEKKGAAASAVDPVNADLIARLAAFEAREVESQAREIQSQAALKTERLARVKASFDAAVTEHRVAPAEFATFEALLEIRECAFVLEQIAARGVSAQFAASPMGHNASDTPAPAPAAPAEPVDHQWAACDLVITNHRSLAKYKTQLIETDSLLKGGRS